MLSMRSFTIKRLTAVSAESKKKSYEETGCQALGFLETASPEYAAIVDGEYGKTFNLFTDDHLVDVKIGDRLIDENDSQAYDVKGVLRNTDGPGRRSQITLTLPIEQ